MNEGDVQCNVEDISAFHVTCYAASPPADTPPALPHKTTQAWFRARKEWVFHQSQAAGAVCVSCLPEEGLPRALHDLAALVCRLAIEPCPDQDSHDSLKGESDGSAFKLSEEGGNGAAQRDPYGSASLSEEGGNGAASLSELLQCCGDSRPDALERFMRLHWEQSPLHLRPASSPSSLPGAEGCCWMASQIEHSPPLSILEPPAPLPPSQLELTQTSYALQHHRLFWPSCCILGWRASPPLCCRAAATARCREVMPMMPYR